MQMVLIMRMRWTISTCAIMVSFDINNIFSILKRFIPGSSNAEQYFIIINVNPAESTTTVFENVTECYAEF